MKRKQIIIPLITLIVLVLTVSVVTAAPKPPMGAFWGLVGNGGTDSTNFLGTTDDQDIVFKRNNDEIMRIEASGIDADGYTEWGSNL